MRGGKGEGERGGGWRGKGEGKKEDLVDLSGFSGGIDSLREKMSSTKLREKKTPSLPTPPPQQ